MVAYSQSGHQGEVETEVGVDSNAAQFTLTFVVAYEPNGRRYQKIEPDLEDFTPKVNKNNV